ncbi:MAG: N-acetylneuraminate synthase [Rhodocyclales bacterium]|nr:N-acetylneuraminate synthase [Rhodocyclales bacterium]
MSRVFIIAEAGVNHNGDEALAMKLVEIAAACGADAVKFQTFSADRLVAKGTAKASYQARETGDGDQHSMLRALELSDAAHAQLAQACMQHGVEFMSTPFDEFAADMLMGLGMSRIKVPSGELTNLPFLRFLAAKGVPLILSTGMADLQEIDDAVNAVKGVWARLGLALPADGLTVLHCTSNYPAAFKDVNLNAMQTIGREIGVPIGYSDHTLGIAVSTAAVALGATVIEKHFTIDKRMSGPDHSASLNPDELKALVDSIRAVEQCLGSAIKAPTATELPIRALVRRSVTLLRDLSAGETIRAQDVALLRPGTGIPPVDMDRVTGRQVKRTLAAGTILNWTDLT